jgi:hypothetical protein
MHICMYIGNETSIQNAKNKEAKMVDLLSVAESALVKKVWMYIYACAYLYIYVLIYVYRYKYIYVYLHIYAYTYVDIYLGICTFISIIFIII